MQSGQVDMSTYDDDCVSLLCAECVYVRVWQNVKKKKKERTNFMGIKFECLMSKSFGLKNDTY